MAIVASNASAAAIPIDDFENYTGRTTDAGYFPLDPNYGASGWGDYYQALVLQDPVIIVDENGPHPLADRSPSGYGNTQGASNMNGNAPGHGQSYAIPGGAVPANSIVRLWAHANLANNTSVAGGSGPGGNSQLYIGDSCLSSGCDGADWEGNISQALLKGAGGLGVGTGGGQPSIAFDWLASSSDTDADGWVQIMIEATIDGAGNMAVATAYHRPAAGGAWTAGPSTGAPADTPATHFAFQASRDVTFDNIMFEIIPEPASLSMLAMGAGLLLLRRRHC